MKKTSALALKAIIIISSSVFLNSCKEKQTKKQLQKQSIDSNIVLELWGERLEEQKFYKEKTIKNLFSHNPNTNSCGGDFLTQIYCLEDVCSFWQINERYSLPEDKYMQIVLQILTAYINFGKKIMNYDPAKTPFKPFTGTDGKTRNWVIEFSDQLCSGYGGAAHNGKSWAAISQTSLMRTIRSINSSNPVVDQVVFYELGRALYDPMLDQILDWQLGDNPSQYGFWTLGFNGAMTVLAPRALKLRMDYSGQDTAGFRKDRLQDLQTLIDGPYNFENTWTQLALPWTAGKGNWQSVNDLMSGLLIYMSENFGGNDFLVSLFQEIKKQPIVTHKSNTRERGNNFYNATIAAAQIHNINIKRIEEFFNCHIKWFETKSPVCSTLDKLDVGLETDPFKEDWEDQAEEPYLDDFGDGCKGLIFVHEGTPIMLFDEEQCTKIDGFTAGTPREHKGKTYFECLDNGVTGSHSWNCRP